MRIIPVIDVKDGRCVQGNGRSRWEYEPVRSQIVNSSEPVTVAAAMMKAVGSQELYIADLNAIMTDGGVSTAVAEVLYANECRCLLDFGVRTIHCLERAMFSLPPLPQREGRKQSNAIFIIATETCRLLADLHEIVSLWPPDQLIGSIDLKAGQLQSHIFASDPREAIDAFLELGFRSLIVLDTARVGSGRGPGTESLCTEIKRSNSNLEVITGGGVSSRDDILRLTDQGVDAVLVSKAIHNGVLP